MTVALIADAIKRLRVIGAASDNADKGVDLWRGMRNVTAAVSFADKGGTELAPMSTTTELAVALEYSLSSSEHTECLLLKLRTESFMQRGADLDFLSCFPGEKEVLFPPLTYLKPTGKTMHITFESTAFRVVEVIPMF